MFYILILLFLNAYILAADSPKVGDRIPMDSTVILLGSLSSETKNEDLVAVKDHNNQLIFAKFSGKYGDGAGAQVAIVNEKGHGFLVPVANVQSVRFLKKTD